MTDEKQQNKEAEEAKQAATAETEPTAQPAEEAAQGGETPTENAEPASREDELEAKVASLVAELAKAKDQTLRAIADMENLRRRLAREKEEIRRTAAAGIVEDLLPILDNFALGLASGENSPETKEITKGFEMILIQFNQVLENNGLKAIAPQQGDAFDLNLHESVAMQPSEDVKEEHILQTVRTGYQLNDRLLRPASVIVSSGKA